MSNTPKRIADTRICVLKYSDEIVICSNVQGFRSLGSWMAWLADSNPEEAFHFHMLWELESEACKFEGFIPKNIWFLSEPGNATTRQETPKGTAPVKNEVTFQVVSEDILDILEKNQESGLIPDSWLRSESSYEADCS